MSAERLVSGKAKMKPVQYGTFYCSGCGRKFRYTHEGYSRCLTVGCPFSDVKERP